MDSREADGGNLVESEILQGDQVKWLVVAAGISKSEAKRLFPVTSNRAERATVPLSVLGAGSASLLLVTRPFKDARATSSVASFAKDIPFIEIREAFFRLQDVENEMVRHLRWEWDPHTASNEPIEKWLLPWKSVVGFNPAHAPSHLHFNSPPFETPKHGRVRRDHDTNELRLAVGIPNPLAFLLSIASWLRRP